MNLISRNEKTQYTLSIQRAPQIRDHWVGRDGAAKGERGGAVATNTISDTATITNIDQQLHTPENLLFSFSLMMKRQLSNK